MTRFFPNFDFELSSFWLGIILAAALLAIFLIYRKRLVSYLARTAAGLKDFRDSLSITSDSDYIQVLFNFTQGLHIYADYYPLDSILVPAKIIAPPPYLNPGNESHEASLVQRAIGYDPLLPHLNSEFSGPTFPLFDAVQTGSNLCLVGFPGTGKTTAIAECISRMIRQPQSDTEADEEAPPPTIPFYVKAEHVLAQFPGQDILGILLKALQLNKSFQVIPNFPKYMTRAVNSDQATFFIDGMDNLPLDDINRLANFISALDANFPSIQVVATASPSCLGKLVSAPVEFLSISPWGNLEKYQFLENLSGIWPSLQTAETGERDNGFTILKPMLVVSGGDQTALEFSMNSVSAFAGEVYGPTSANALGSFLDHALALNDSELRSLQLAALYCLDTNSGSFSRRELHSWFHGPYRKNNNNPTAIQSAAFQSVLQAAVDHKILEASSDNRYHFLSPTVAGYLAAEGLSTAKKVMVEEILGKPGWGLLHEAMRFFSNFNDIKPFLNPMLADKHPLMERLVRATSWLEHTTLNSPEEMALLKQATREIQTNPIYLVKLRLVCALAKSKNPQIKAIFQHLQKSPDVDNRRAAAVGLGLIQDLSAVPTLIKQLNDLYPSSTAACYALGKIGSPLSLEAIAEALLHGSEILRRAAAESLAQNRSEGHPALREGSTMDDLLIRYAVVHGLRLIPEPWALEILDTMRIDEKEWIVRDLAQQSYEILTTRSPYLPYSAPPAHAAPWLSEFASQQSFPPPAPENALDLLLEALDLGSELQKQNALAYLARNGDQRMVSRLAALSQGNVSDLAHQAALTLWCFSTSQQISS